MSIVNKLEKLWNEYPEGELPITMKEIKQVGKELGMKGTGAWLKKDQRKVVKKILDTIHEAIPEAIPEAIHEEEQKEEQKEETPKELSRQELERMNVKQLKEVAKTLSITLPKKVLKAPLKNLIIETLFPVPNEEPESLQQVLQKKVEEMILLLQTMKEEEYLPVLEPLLPFVLKQNEAILITPEATPIIQRVENSPMVILPPEKPNPKEFKQRPQGGYMSVSSKLLTPLNIGHKAVSPRGERSLLEYQEQQSFMEEEKQEIDIPVEYRTLDLHFENPIPVPSTIKKISQQQVDDWLNEVKETETPLIDFPDVEYNIRKCLGMI